MSESEEKWTSRLEHLRRLLEVELPSFTATMELLREYAELNPGHGIPADYYRRGAKVFPQASPQLLILRENEDIEIEIFLIRRPDDDPEWPGQWHFPGTTHRYNDTIEDMMNRLLQGELGGANLEPALSMIYITGSEERERGPCTHLIYIAWVESDVEFASGTFHPINSLPSPMIKHHENMIVMLQMNGIFLSEVAAHLVDIEVTD